MSNNNSSNKCIPSQAGECPQVQSGIKSDANDEMLEMTSPSSNPEDESPAEETLTSLVEPVKGGDSFVNGAEPHSINNPPDGLTSTQRRTPSPENGSHDRRVKSSLQTERSSSPPLDDPIDVKSNREEGEGGGSSRELSVNETRFQCSDGDNAKSESQCSASQADCEIKTNATDPYSFSEENSNTKVNGKKGRNQKKCSVTPKLERGQGRSVTSTSRKLKRRKQSSPKMNERRASSSNQSTASSASSMDLKVDIPEQGEEDLVMDEDEGEEEEEIDEKVCEATRISSPEDSLEDGENRLVIAEDEQPEVEKSAKAHKAKNGGNVGVAKPRRKHNRFNGMSEDEVAKRLLPDVISEDLDILIIGINPGMYAAYKGHHYAGPGNHFWKCLYLSGLIPRPMTAEDDVKCREHGIGFTNIVERTTKGSANLSRKEILDGTQYLVEKIKKYKPKIAVFNGKGIYEVFSNNKEFHLGKQPNTIEETDTHVWVMPNSSARCAQLPRAVDKVPFYTALKKFRDYLTGAISQLNDDEVVFRDVKLKNFNESTQKKLEKAGLLNTSGTDSGGDGPKMNSEFKVLPSEMSSGDMPAALDIRIDPITGKKRRGRPPKPRPDGTIPPPKRRAMDASGNPIPRGSNPIDPLTGKKKRGRPKKADAPPGSSMGPHSSKRSSKKRDLNDVALGDPVSGGELEVNGDLEAHMIHSGAPSHSGSNSNSSSNVGGGMLPGPSAMANKPTKIVPPLPPFSPNFACGDLPEVDEKPVDLKKPFFERHHPPSITHGEDPDDRLNGPGSGMCGGGHPTDYSRSQDHASEESLDESERYAAQPPSGSYHYPPNDSGNPPNHGSNYVPYNVTPPHNPSVSSNVPSVKSDDVTTKSITGLESLVDQIPAIAAENDSGVFSGTSAAGSHPNTPRSVGPYSPAPYPSSFHTPQPSGGSASSLPPPNSAGSSSFPNYSNVPSTSDLGSESTNYSQLPSAIAASATSSAPTDFSVNSLVYSNNNGATSSNADPFSVSSLTSSSHHHHAAAAADMMMSKYHGLPTGTSHPYAAAAGMFPSSSSFGTTAGFLGGAGNTFSANPMQAAMGHMGMSYYGQYPNAYGPAHHGFGTSPYTHGLHMPNPSYPYPSPYSQSPYSQSPYF